MATSASALSPADSTRVRAAAKNASSSPSLSRVKVTVHDGVEVDAASGDVHDSMSVGAVPPWSCSCATHVVFGKGTPKRSVANSSTVTVFASGKMLAGPWWSGADVAACTPAWSRRTARTVTAVLCSAGVSSFRAGATPTSLLASLLPKEAVTEVRAPGVSTRAARSAVDATLVASVYRAAAVAVVAFAAAGMAVKAGGEAVNVRGRARSMHTVSVVLVPGTSSSWAAVHTAWGVQKPWLALSASLNVLAGHGSQLTVSLL